MPSTRLYGPQGAPGAAGSVALNTSGATAGVLPASLTLATTTETVIPNPALNSPTSPLLLSIPPSGPLEQRVFDILASGWLNTGASSTVTIKLYSGTSATPGSNTLLGSSGALTAFAGKAPWYFRATCVYDSNSGKLNGTIKFISNNQLVAEVVLSNVVSGLNNANNPVANFVISVQFGTGNAANQITVQDFAVAF